MAHNYGARRVGPAAHAGPIININNVVNAAQGSCHGMHDHNARGSGDDSLRPVVVSPRGTDFALLRVQPANTDPGRKRPLPNDKLLFMHTDIRPVLVRDGNGRGPPIYCVAVSFDKNGGPYVKRLLTANDIYGRPQGIDGWVNALHLWTNFKPEFYLPRNTSIHNEPLPGSPYKKFLDPCPIATYGAMGEYVGVVPARRIGGVWFRPITLRSVDWNPPKGWVKKHYIGRA